MSPYRRLNQVRKCIEKWHNAPFDTINRTRPAHAFKKVGGLRPCSMFEETYGSQKEILKKFVPRNNCGGCYVSIRSYLDASFWTLLADNVKTRVLSRNGRPKEC